MDAIDKLKGIRYVLYQVEKDLSSLQNVYNDKRSNISEAGRYVSDAITNIEGHLKDIKIGAE